MHNIFSNAKLSIIMKDIKPKDVAGTISQIRQTMENQQETLIEKEIALTAIRREKKEAIADIRELTQRISLSMHLMECYLEDIPKIKNEMYHIYDRIKDLEINTRILRNESVNESEQNNIFPK